MKATLLDSKPMNSQHHTAVFSCLTLALLTTGCDNSDSSQTQVEPVTRLVSLEEIPNGILTISETSEGRDGKNDLHRSLALLQNTITGESNSAKPAYYVGDLYGDGEEYWEMIAIQEESPEMDQTYADPTTSDEYKKIMEQDRLDRPHDFDGIYSWAGPEVEGYDEVLKTLPKEDPTYKTPEQREDERKLVEIDVTEQYLDYHRHNNRTQTGPQGKRTKRPEQPEEERIPNIQEYIRAKRNGTI